ncbi:MULTISPECIES: antA/AntB antirepressor family protein [unclassified Pseudomonas]|uniref:antA/AntB antirepressor family protein n=1 Tax=unclassified Pseudomonas TaxID=196821 RepID=UPI0007316F89|nr:MULTISPECIES: antA/AntB antirepressor family protein [unclassified Pseudomonas]KSW22778.1 hypothetical protein AOX63_04995 [Pseudomonas sp. ADP]OBP09724.1 hypothetical protein BAE52_17860 [Pseudomonas sp. EGD-AKN5]
MHADQELIPVFTGPIHNESTQLVDARSLHRFLSIDTDFRKWVARRIEEYGFQEGEDFRSFLGESSGGRRSREYHITLDMAKELSMVERNEKGRQARRYFIECEKRLQQVAPQEAATIRDQTIGTDGFHMLGALIKGKVSSLPAPVQRRATAKIWSQTHAAFGVRSAADIPAEQLDAARNFIAAYALEGEWLPKVEVVSTVGPCEWSNVGALINCVEQCWRIMERSQLSHHLSSLGCKTGLEIASFLYDALGSAAHVKKYCASELDWRMAG